MIDDQCPLDTYYFWKGGAMSTIKHGSIKQTFASGAQRDTAAGKPNYRLIPTAFLSNLAFALADLKERDEEKYDKVRLDLLPAVPLIDEAIHYGEGAKHYGENNYQKGIPFSRVVESLLRHAHAVADDLHDEDHLSAVRWNAGVLRYYEEEIYNGRLPFSLNDIVKKPIEEAEEGQENAYPDPTPYPDLAKKVEDPVYAQEDAEFAEDAEEDRTEDDREDKGTYSTSQLEEDPAAYAEEGSEAAERGEESKLTVVQANSPELTGWAEALVNLFGCNPNQPATKLPEPKKQPEKPALQKFPFTGYGSLPNYRKSPYGCLPYCPNQQAVQASADIFSYGPIPVGDYYRDMQKAGFTASDALKARFDLDVVCWNDPRPGVLTTWLGFKEDAPNGVKVVR